MDPDELWTKFVDCTRKTHAEKEARRLFDLLQGVDKLSSTRDLPTCEKVFVS
jgi:hypothetical protein